MQWADEVSRKLLWRFPKTQRAMLRGQHKISIGGDEGEIVSEAKLRDQCVDGSDLDSSATAAVPQFGRTNVIFSIWDHHR